MSKPYEQIKIIEYLQETPLVSFACKKTGIARATYYRWYNHDKKFKELVDAVLKQGRENINDLAKATLFKMIKEGNYNAIRFWLQHNDPVFRPVRTEYIDPNADSKKNKHKPTSSGSLSSETLKRLDKIFPDLKN